MPTDLLPLDLEPGDVLDGEPRAQVWGWPEQEGGYGDVSVVVEPLDERDLIEVRTFPMIQPLRAFKWWEYH